MRADAIALAMTWYTMLCGDCLAVLLYSLISCTIGLCDFLRVPTVV